MVAWGIASVDEKQSPDGSLLSGGLIQGDIVAAPQSASVGPSPIDTPSAPERFELTSLIKTLPQPLPRATPTWHAPDADPVATEPAITSAATPSPPAPPSPEQHAAPSSITHAPAVAAPAFTPFVPPSERLASSQPPPLSNPPAAKPATSVVKRFISVAATTLRFGAIVFASWFVTVMALIALFRFVDPPQSMLMLTKRLGGETLQHEWTTLPQISTNLRRAVITSEDSKFCRHWGFDLDEIRTAMARTNGYGRGASTITQQLAKNLFLWPGKSYVRKALEVPLTLAMEAMWSKKRILEIYLNVAEWGPGVFGAEAAAQYYFNKPASKLTEREATLLAVSLPNPIARDASDPNPAIARRAATLQARMRVQGISYCALTPKAN